MTKSLTSKSTKDIGNIGERVAGDYLKKEGFSILERNVKRKIGEIDIVAKRKEVLHIVEVKTRLCTYFPDEKRTFDFEPEDNLDARKIRQVVRVGEWYVAEKEWEGEWQVDGVVVWLRESDGSAQIRYLPQIV